MTIGQLGVGVAIGVDFGLLGQQGVVEREEAVVGVRGDARGGAVETTRPDVNRISRPSGVKEGWLSYPRLLVMLVGVPTINAPSTSVKLARKMSVSGGGGVPGAASGGAAMGT